jgi:selenocysteine-specific elongation factor
VAPGTTAFARLRLESPAVLTRGDRFILRAYSPPITIGGGGVLDAAPVRPGIRSDDGRASLARLAITPDHLPALLEMIDASGLAGVAQGMLLSRAGIAPQALATVIDALAARGVVAAGDRLVAARHLQKAADALLSLVAATHKAQPASEGLPREEARGKIFAKSAPAIFERVLDDLKARRALVGAERLALPTHKATVAGADDRVRAAIIQAYRDGGLKPDAATIATQANAPAPLVEKVTSLLLREKILIKIDTIVFHADTLSQLKADLAALKASAPGGKATVDVGTFKDRYGISRKYAIPLLEFLDRERVTKRTGDVRLVL